MTTINKEFYKSCCKVALSMDGKRCPICRTDLPYRAKASDLRIGDEVKALDGGGYTTATVTGILLNGSVRLVRPYVHTSDFLHSDGVTPYLGWEEYSIYPSTEVIVLRESTLPEVVKDETDEGRRLRRAR